MELVTLSYAVGAVTAACCVTAVVVREIDACRKRKILLRQMEREQRRLRDEIDLINRQKQQIASQAKSQIVALRESLDNPVAIKGLNAFRGLLPLYATTHGDDDALSDDEIDNIVLAGNDLLLDMHTIGSNHFWTSLARQRGSIPESVSVVNRTWRNKF